MNNRERARDLISQTRVLVRAWGGASRSESERDAVFTRITPLVEQIFIQWGILRFLFRSFATM